MTRAGALPPHSARMQRYFNRYLRRYFRRHFTGVRVSADGLPPPAEDTPVILCTNHPAWWDPILLMVVADEFYPGRPGYGPVEATVVDRYRILGRLGPFGVDRRSRQGLAEFLRRTDAILGEPRSLLGITAEGEFRDPRLRPVRLEPGIAHVMRRNPAIPVLPVALEYPFWNERAPEALVRFGTPLTAAERPEAGVEELLASVEAALTQTMDELAEQAIARDPGAFRTIIDGETGVGGFYDVFQRLRAWLSGREFDPSHAAASRRVEKK